jgi:deleted-in-malignant-brain-tumors protein 1
VPLDSTDSVPESCANEDEIRLFHGSSPLEGKVGLCRSGSWGNICSIGWDSLDADVVCRQVGRQLGVTIFRKYFVMGMLFL